MPDSYYGGGNSNSGYGNIQTNWNSGGGGNSYNGSSSNGGIGNMGGGQGSTMGGVQPGQKQGQQSGVNAAAAAAAAMAVARAAQQAQQQKQQQSQQNRSPLQSRMVSSQGFGNLPETSMRPGPGFNGGLGIQPYGQGHLSAQAANMLAQASQVKQPNTSQWSGISGGTGLQAYGQGTRSAARANQISQATQVPGYGMPGLPGNIPNPNMHHETAMNGGFGIPGYGMGNNAGLPARQQPSQIASAPRFNGVGGGVGIQAYGNSVRSADAASGYSKATQVQGAPQVAAGTGSPAPTNYMAMRSALGELGGPLMPPQSLITAARSAGGNPMPAGGQVVAGPETQPDPPDSWYGSLKNKVGSGLEVAKAAGQKIYDSGATPEAVKGYAKGGLLGAALGYMTGGNPLGFAPQTAMQVYPGSMGISLSGAGGQGGGMSNPTGFGGNYGGGGKKKKKKPEDDTDTGGGTNSGGVNYPGYYSTWAGLPKGPVLG